MSLPETMRFIQATGAGGPEVLQLASGPLPRCAPDEVVIRVQAAGVNRPDVMQRSGLYPPPKTASPVIGLEVAGEVVALGAEAAGWPIGMQVCALTNGGGYAEYCVAPTAQCLAWPDGYDAIGAAALPETMFTVWANLFERGRLAAGESALVHGGSSGIGVTAIQLGAALGATVYVTAGSAEKCAACERLGAAAAIDYRTQDFVAEIKRLTDGRGVDVVLDMVGGDYVARDVACLAMDGRLVFIAFQRGSKVDSFDFLPVMMRRLSISGSTMRPRTTAQKGEIARALRQRVWPLLDAGKCAPPIAATFDLADAADAHRLMEGGSHIGKIVLRVGG